MIDLYVIGDLKTTNRKPAGGQIKRDHLRQGAVYLNAHPNAEMRFIYVTPRELVVLRQEKVAGPLSEIQAVGRAIEQFLCLSKDKAELAALCTVNLDALQWRGEPMRKAAREIFGIED